MEGQMADDRAHLFNLTQSIVDVHVFDRVLLDEEIAEFSAAMGQESLVCDCLACRAASDNAVRVN